MEDLIPPPPEAWRRLCRIDEIPNDSARGFPPAAPGFAGLFAVRRDGEVHVYVNSCPHLGVSLEWTTDRFLSADRAHIVCGTHGAAFRIADGVCLRGPCYGAALTPVLIEINDGMIRVPADSGRRPAG